LSTPSLSVTSTQEIPASAIVNAASATLQSGNTVATSRLMISPTPIRAYPQVSGPAMASPLLFPRLMLFGKSTQDSIVFIQLKLCSQTALSYVIQYIGQYWGIHKHGFEPRLKGQLKEAISVLLCWFWPLPLLQLKRIKSPAHFAEYQSISIYIL